MSTPEGPEPRCETGVTRFGDDWPGCFIRGDSAFAYAEALQALLDKARHDLQTIGGRDVNQFTAVLTLESLLLLLRDSDTGRPKSSQYREQILKPFKDCTK